MPYKEDRADIIKLVSKLNDEFVRKALEASEIEIEIVPWSMTCDGESAAILFLQEQVWSDFGGDEREVLKSGADCDGPENETPDGWPVYEDLEVFVRRKAQEIVDQLSSVRLYKAGKGEK